MIYLNALSPALLIVVLVAPALAHRKPWWNDRRSATAAWAVYCGIGPALGFIWTAGTPYEMLFVALWVAVAVAGWMAFQKQIARFEREVETEPEIDLEDVLGGAIPVEEVLI